MKKVIFESVWKFIPIIVSFLAMFYLLAGSEARKSTKTVFFLFISITNNIFICSPTERSWVRSPQMVPYCVLEQDTLTPYSTS